LRALFGFIVEGCVEPDDIDADTVHLHGFRVTDPSGVEQAVREAVYAREEEQLGSPRSFQVRPDGSLYEVDYGGGVR
jgi:hypothetical protein